jgi:ceramide glucosyltransferase
MSAALSALSLLLSAGLWACLRATQRHFRGAPAQACGTPMTLIRPVRGLDDAMPAAFESLVEADPRGVLQIVIALEDADDPAYGAARAFADAHPDRDVEVVLTGPPRGRMGKIHNMIEALPRAKNDRVLFSDADVRVTRALLADAARAFAAGADAVYGMPVHEAAPGLGGWWLLVAFNHAYGLPAALSARLGLLRSYAGAFCGFTRGALARVGGLEPFSHAIAEDLSLGLAGLRAGLRQELLREPCRLSETGTGAAAVLAHLVKWGRVIFWTWPAVWLLAPLGSPVLAALAAAGWAAARGEPLALPLAALAAAAASRALVGFLQDRFFGVRAAAWKYPSLALADLGALVLVPLGLRPTAVWRGTRYRLRLGGRAEVAR